MELSLDRPPAGISATAWLAADRAEPKASDLWLLSWDGVALGLAVVAGVAPTFVLVWPVTLPDEPVFPPAIAVPASPIGPIAIWPTRETGVGKHLLHRRLGTALPERTMAAIVVAVENGAEPPLTFASPNLPESDREAASDEMIDRWEAICLHVWPQVQVGATPFDPAALTAAGLEVSGLRDALDIPVPQAVALFSGETNPSADQISAIADQLGVSEEQLLRATLDEVATEMLATDIKDDLLRIARRRGTDEAGARALVRSELALAARSDGALRSRLDAAIHRLVSKGSR